MIVENKQSTEPIYYYECQERAMAPGIGDGWPEIIEAPHTRNARLVRREGNPAQLVTDLAAEREHAQRAVDQAEAFKDELDQAKERAEKAEPHLYCCPDEINCGRRWEAPDENDGEDCPFCGLDTLRSENAALREGLEDAKLARDLLYDAPEINPSNYDHEQVCELNSKVIEAYGLLDDTLARLTMQEGSDQALHDGTTCCVCAGKGEMPERDFTTEPMNGSPPASSWYRDDDGTTSIERAYATLSSMYQQERAENERLREALKTLTRAVSSEDLDTFGSVGIAWDEAMRVLAPKETTDE